VECFTLAFCSFGLCVSFPTETPYQKLVLSISAEVGYVFYDLSPLEQGWYSTAVYAAIISGTTVSGVVFQIGAYHRLKLIFFNVLMVAFIIGASQAHFNQRSVTTACACLCGFAACALETITLLWVAAGRSVENIGLSLGMLGSFRSIGGAIAQAIFVAILTNKAAVLVPEAITKQVLAAGLPTSSLPQFFEALTAGTSEAFSRVPGITTSILAAMQLGSAEGYFSSFKYMYYTMIAFGGLSLLLACCAAKDVAKEMTNFVGKSLYNGKGGEDLVHGDSAVAVADDKPKGQHQIESV
jgi:hypothetical protein